LRLVDRRAGLAIKRCDSVDAMKADECAYWRQRSAQEGFAAVSEISNDAYGLKDAGANAPRLQRTLIRLLQE
jgi:hypothetical protein